MEVVAVPSIPNQTHLYSVADEIINSLLDLQLEKWGLPAFEDWVEGTLPVESWHIGGPVIKALVAVQKFLEFLQEPWLLYELNGEFYGEELRLAVVGYIRPQANFSSLDDLTERIHEDRRIAEKALDLPMYSSYKNAPYIIMPLANHDQ